MAGRKRVFTEVQVPGANLSLMRSRCKIENRLMPRYYFRLCHDRPNIAQEEGVDLPDEEAAWAEATRTCGEILADMDGALKLGSAWRMEVRDENGPLFQISFDATRLRRGVVRHAAQ